MVSGQNSKFVVSKCSCGVLKRGGEFKRHTNKAGESHKKAYSFRVCLSHMVRKASGETEEDFYRLHRECPPAKSNAANIRKWLEKVDKEVELEAAFENITGAGAENVDLDTDLALSDTSSSDSEVSAIIVRKRAASVLEEDETPRGSSTPCKKSMLDERRGLKEQNRIWTEDLEAKAISQKSAIEGLRDMLHRTRQHNKELMGENARLRVQSDKYPATKKELDDAMCREAEWFKEKREMLSKMVMVEQWEKEVKETRAKMEKMKSEVEEVHVMRSELERLKGVEDECRRMKLSVGRHSYDFHLPIQNGIVVDTPIVCERDLDVTQECYEYPQANVRCIHGEIQTEGALRSFHIRKVKQRIPSKY